MELYASEYERQLREFRGITDDWEPGLVVQAKSETGAELLMVQDHDMWQTMMDLWDGHLWPLWPRPINDALGVWEGFYAYYEMRPVGMEAPVALCTTPEIHTWGSTPVRIIRCNEEGYWK